jgi:hypothetical protein
VPSRIHGEAQAELRSEQGDVPDCRRDGGGFRQASVWAATDPDERRADESTAHAARAMMNRVLPRSKRRKTRAALAPRVFTSIRYISFVLR